MKYIAKYDSPIGELLLASDGTGLTGLWLEGQKHYALGLDEYYEQKNFPVFSETKRWLDVYFSAQEPDFIPNIHMLGTPFQLEVWKQLIEIPYGNTITYADIAEKIAQKRGITHMSARAVGNAVAHNKISVIIPCHRVIGADGSITGYAGGINRKMHLLKTEGIDISVFRMPKKNAREKRNGQYKAL